ncbi:MAG: hypothetical protein ABL993_05770 [Vicinamibacterales bacterium]
MPRLDTNMQIKNLDHRVSTIEQILPTLATKDDLQNAVAPLATREEMRTAIRAEGEETRRHFDVVAEALRVEIHVIAEGYVHVNRLP